MSLRSRREGAVRVLTLARPPGNALTLETLRALRDAAAEAGADARTRALVIESSTPRYFSSGLDLEELESLPRERRTEPFEALVGAYRALLDCPKPTVAAVSGSALLGGWIVAMACDWRLLGEGARIALSEIRAGLSPTPALLERLRALSRDPRAVKDMALRGRALPAQEAFAAGLVDGLLPEEQVAGEALELARRLAKSPPRAYADVKRALNAPSSGDALWERSLAEFRALFETPDAREGLAALRGKRRPRWEAP